MVIPWWLPLVTLIVGAALTYGITEFRERRQRKRENRAHIEALAVELQICGEQARGYLKGNVMAPAYRMPLVAYQRSLPALVGNAVLRFSEINAIVRFYMNAMAFNFSLDHAQAVLMKKEEDRPPKMLDRETRRARMKAKKLQKPDGGHYKGAISVIRVHLPKDSWARLELGEAEGDLEEEVAEQ